MKGFVREQYRKYFVSLLKLLDIQIRNDHSHKQQKSIHIHEKKRILGYTFQQCPNLDFLTWRLELYASSPTPSIFSLTPRYTTRTHKNTPIFTDFAALM
jgi:hypothetical protein